jgi:hypothetical protein
MDLYPEASVELADGTPGEVADLVVDPRARRVTHLVVSVAGLHDGARLIPIEAMVSCADHVLLSWSSAQAARAPHVQEIALLDLESWPQTSDGWDVGVVRMLAYPFDPSTWPNCSSNYTGYGLGSMSGGRSASATVFDQIPAGTAEIQRVSVVLSSDHHVVGHVTALGLNAEHVITHLVIDRGHWWAHCEITLPIGDVLSLATDLVQLGVARAAVGTYPSVRLHRHHHAALPAPPPRTDERLAAARPRDDAPPRTQPHVRPITEPDIPAASRCPR